MDQEQLDRQIAAHAERMRKKQEEEEKADKDRQAKILNSYLNKKRG